MSLMFILPGLWLFSLTVSTTDVSVLLCYLVLCLVALLNSSVKMLTKVTVVLALTLCLLWEARSLATPGPLVSGAGDLSMQTVKGSSKVPEEAPNTLWSHEARMLKRYLVSLCKLRWRWSTIATQHSVFKPELRTGTRSSICCRFRRSGLSFHLVLRCKRRPLKTNGLVGNLSFSSTSRYTRQD